ncbi:MAG: molybdenum cofactor carrier [Sedimenticola sp.]|nr:MAG: molybdenum cofactor carrier [Sedimenticola sp.]
MIQDWQGLNQVVSGGQTGVDRAGLDAAQELEIPIGGWCPKGRKAEDGKIADRYSLRETASGDYAVRTEWNVRDSDATLILNLGALEGGTALTEVFARQHQRPCLIVALDQHADAQLVIDWLRDNQVGVLNIAGPRESKRPGVYGAAREFLLELLVQTNIRP